jgi:hypothetical protein
MRESQLTPKSVEVTTDVCRKVIADYFQATPQVLQDNPDVHKDATNPKKWKRIERYKPDHLDLNTTYDAHDNPLEVYVFTPGVDTNLIQGDSLVPLSKIKLARRFDLNSEHMSLNVLVLEDSDGKVHIAEINPD